MLEASCDSTTHSSRTLVIIYPGLYINVGFLTYPNDLMIQADPTHQLYLEIIMENVAELKCIKRNSMLLSSRCKAMSEVHTYSVFSTFHAFSGIVPVKLMFLRTLTTSYRLVKQL
jgi:hypothetical protein